MYFSFSRSAVVSVLVGLLAGACQPDKPSSHSAATPPASTTPPSPAAHAAYQGIRRYTGQVGKYPVVVELAFSDAAASGTYYYLRHGQALTLQADPAAPGEPLRLRELLGDSLLARWQAAQPAGPVLRGTWWSADGKRQLPFALQEDYRGAVRYAIEEFESHGKQAVDSITCPRAGDTVRLQLAVVHLLTSPNNKLLQQVQQQLLLAPYTQLQAYVEKWVADGGECSTVDQSAEVTYNADSLFSVTLFEQRYQFGGAHPTHQSTPLTFDLRTGRKLLLREVLRPGAEQSLRRLLTKRLQQHPIYKDFYREAGGQAGQPFEWWHNDQGRPQAFVPLPQSGFRLTPAGVEFEWGEYEIGPYVIGPQTVEVSYPDIQPLLQPTSALAGVVARFN